MPRALTVPSTFSWTEVSGLELKGAFPSALSYLFLFPSSPGLPQASPPSRSAPSLHRDLFGCGEELPAGCGRTPSAAVLPLRRRVSEATRAAAAAATSSALPPVSATRARMRGPAPGGGGRRADPGFGAQRRAGREIYGLCTLSGSRGPRTSRMVPHEPRPRTGAAGARPCMVPTSLSFLNR